MRLDKDAIIQAVVAVVGWALFIAFQFGFWIWVSTS